MIYLTMTICLTATGECHELTIPQPFESQQQCNVLSQMAILALEVEFPEHRVTHFICDQARANS